MSPSVSTSPNLRLKRSKHAQSLDRSDPLSIALLPPTHESPTARAARLSAEAAAKSRSDEIDRFLSSQPSSSLATSTVSSECSGSKKGRVYKMVLLGQAGAGKTTVLKQMRLLYDPDSHEKERRGWTRIVLLNLTASARVLLQTMERYLEERAERKSAELNRMEMEVPKSPLLEEERDRREEMPVDRGPKDERNTSASVGVVGIEHLPRLIELERRLRVELGAFAEEEDVGDGIGEKTSTRSGEKSPLLLRPGWQERLFTYARRSLSLSPSSPSDTVPASNIEEEDEVLAFLRLIQRDILSIWTTDPRCRALRKRGLFFDAQSDASTSYFLDHYSRLVSSTFSPSDDDILHSRVRTLGITESLFRVDRTLLYRIYDVGGSRSQRQRWASYLDDAEAIIFLAPLSAFDQPLVEDPSVNRLADSFDLFSQVVSNPLLKRASVILFLNKIDLLEKKLKAGVRLGRYWTEYQGDNDFEAVWRWFRGKFRDCLRRAEDEMGGGEKRRTLYVHTTVATSTKQIRAILMSVKDSILRENLRATGLVG